MTANLIDTLTPATLAALGKLAADEAKGNRENLAPGSYSVDEQVILHVRGTVNVGEDYDQRFVNKAKPWSLVYVLLTELNTERAAVGKTGMDMAALIKLAEAVDPDLVKKAQAEAEGEAATIKAATSKTAKGKVTIKGTVDTIGKVVTAPATSEVATA